MKKKETLKKMLLQKTSAFKEVREADRIIAFLKNPDGESSLPANLKEKLLKYEVIHGLRLRYKQHDYIIGYLREFHKVKSVKQARKDIAEAEYIFGKAIYVNRAYELNFLIQLSIKNIELAMASKNVKLITMALQNHHALLGPEVDDSEIPDINKWEQHTYNMILPPNVASIFDKLTAAGAIDLNKIITGKMLEITANETKTR